MTETKPLPKILFASGNANPIPLEKSERRYFAVNDPDAPTIDRISWLLMWRNRILYCATGIALLIMIACTAIVINNHYTIYLMIRYQVLQSFGCDLVTKSLSYNEQNIRISLWQCEE